MPEILTNPKEFIRPGASVILVGNGETARNSGLGPTQADSQPLFHTNRANIGPTGR